MISIRANRFARIARATKIQIDYRQTLVRKRGGVQKSMGNKVPWKIGMLIYLPVTSRAPVSLQKEAVLSPCNFATACILKMFLP